jgi:hypothetical protein
MKASRLGRTSPLSLAMLAVWGPEYAALADSARLTSAIAEPPSSSGASTSSTAIEKLRARLGEDGAFQKLIVRWDGGTLQQVTIGPTIGRDGKPAICVLARRQISSQLSASAEK